MPVSPRVEIHHDFAVLERRLEDLLRALGREHGPLAPAAVVVPTARLRAHLQERMATRCGTLLQVRFFHHDSLAAEAAADAAASGARGAALRPIGDAALATILADAAARAGGPLARWLQAVPTGAGAVLATLQDLREAGIDPAAAGSVAGLSDETRALLPLYAAYCEALKRLRRAGFADRAGRIAAALDHLPAFARRHRLLVHYGAYELVGMNLDLMHAAQASGIPTVHLVPGHPTSPAFAYARSFWKEAFGVDPVAIDGSAAEDDHRLLAASLPVLYDEEAAGRVEPEVRLFHAQGSGGELREAALLALQDHADLGTEARRIAVLARSLDPYTDRLADLARALALPLTTSGSAPIATAPAARAALLLLRAVLLDFPAAPLIELARCGLLVAPRGTDPAIAAGAWERLLRHYRIAGGRDLLTRALPRWVEESPPPAARRPGPGSDEEMRRRRALVADAVHLGRFVGALDRRSTELRAARGGAAFAAAAHAFLASRLTPFLPGAADDAGVTGVAAALGDLEALDAAEVRLESPAAALAALERLLAAARAPLSALGTDGEPRGRDEGGIRVFDVMQARGLAFDTVVLLGMNAGRFPRPARPDPFLADDDRRRLRAALGRPVPVKDDSRLEEHLLLALALGGARRRVIVGWQRADEEGRALSPSLALREIARVARGTPDLEAIVATARPVAADPRREASDVGRDASGVAREPALLSRGEALVAAALDAGSPQGLASHLEALRPLVPGDLAGDLVAGLAFLAGIESPEDRGFDALVGPSAAAVDPGAPRPGHLFSPSRLETLGACPQRYFFRHLLHLEEWEDLDAAHALDPREIGIAAHEALAAVSTRAAADPRGIGTAIASEVRAAWAAATERIAARLDALYPGLWDLVGGSWRDALVRFVERDLPPLLDAGDPFECETFVEAALPLAGRPEPLLLGGRFDRLRTASRRLIVTDYKTGGDPSLFVRPAEFLKGRRLQMALYAFLAETGTRRSTGEQLASREEIVVEVLGVGPRSERAPEKARAQLDPQAMARARAGILETLGVLVRLVDLGLYPLNESSDLCQWCDFRRACRRAHRPTLERLKARPELRDYLLLRRKNTRAPLLADVAAAGGNGADE